MLLWLSLAMITIIALVGVLFPLLRVGDQDSTRSDYDLHVYSSQLEELDLDLERGVISPGEEEAARIELKRRILSVTAENTTSLPNVSHQPQIIGAIILAIGVPVISSGLYLHLGSPQSSGQPVIQQASEVTLPKSANNTLEAAVDNVQAKLALDPGNIENWLLLGQSYTVMRRYNEAAQAYRHATNLKPNDAIIKARLGETLVLAANGTVTPEAVSVFDNARALDKKIPGPRFYLGLARAQAGDPDSAYDTWLQLVNDASTNAPWLPEVIARLREVGAILGRNVDAALKPMTPLADKKQAISQGPTQAEIEASADMSSEERLEMIRGMVSRLSNRLREDPTDIAGLERLAHSYEVLGDVEKSRETRNRIQQIRIGSERTKEADILASSKDLEAPSEGRPKSTDQSDMILGMVQGLAARLQDNPDNLDGWLMLAKSHQVLGQPEKQLEALRRALEIAPNNPNIIGRLARAILNGNREADKLPSASVKLFERVLKLDENNTEALYFVGLAKAQKGEISLARIKWTKLLSKLDVESRARELVQQQLNRLPNNLKVQSK